MRFVVVSVLLVSVAAWAQSKAGDDDDDDASSSGTDKGNLNVTEKGGAEGVYKGVAPGAQALPPHPPQLPLKKGPQRMTWSGFQVQGRRADGVPRGHRRRPTITSRTRRARSW